MDKILTTGDTYKFESGDKLLAIAMRTIRDRINDIVEWINAKDNNQGGNTDDPGSGDDPTQDPTTDPEQPKKSISIKLLSESSNNAVIKIDIKNAVGSQISLAEYTSSGSLSYEGYTKRTVGSNDSSYLVTVSKKDSTYKVVGVIYGDTNILSNVIDIKAKDTELIPESNAPTISEQQVHENENSVEISVVASNAKLKYISLVEVNKLTNTNTLVPGAREDYITTENNFAFGWTIERRSEDFYVKAILHDLVLQPSDLNNPVYSTDEILIKAKTTSGEGDNPTVDNPSRAYVASAMARYWEEPEEETATVTDAVVISVEGGAPITPNVITSGLNNSDTDPWKRGRQYGITPIGSIHVTTDLLDMVNNGGYFMNGTGYSVSVNLVELFPWLYNDGGILSNLGSSVSENAKHPERLLGSKYVLEAKVRVDDTNYGIQTFMKNDNGDWITAYQDSANTILVESVPTLFLILNDPDKYNNTFANFDNFSIGKGLNSAYYGSKNHGSANSVYFGIRGAEELVDAMSVVDWSDNNPLPNTMVTLPVFKSHLIPIEVANLMQDPEANYIAGKDGYNQSIITKEDTGYTAAGEYVINNAVMIRNTIDYGGTRCRPIYAPASQQNASGNLLAPNYAIGDFKSNLYLKIKVVNEESNTITKDRFNLIYYHPVVVCPEKTMSLVVGIIRDDIYNTKMGKLAARGDSATEVIDDALLNDYDPRVRYIFLAYNKFKFRQFISREISLIVASMTSLNYQAQHDPATEYTREEWEEIIKSFEQYYKVNISRYTEDPYNGWYHVIPQDVYNLGFEAQKQYLLENGWVTGAVKGVSIHDTIILDPGCDYQIRAEKRARERGKGYNTMAPVRVIDVLLDYASELLLTYLGPRMPWEKQNVHAITNVPGWETNMPHGYTMLDLDWYWRSGGFYGTEPYATQWMDKLIEEKYEDRKKVAKKYALTIKRPVSETDNHSEFVYIPDPTYIINDGNTGEVPIITNPIFANLGLMTYDEYVEYLCGANFTTGTFYDDIQFTGANYSLVADKRQYIKDIIFDSNNNKSEIRNMPVTNAAAGHTIINDEGEEVTVGNTMDQVVTVKDYIIGRLKYLSGEDLIVEGDQMKMAPSNCAYANAVVSGYKEITPSEWISMIDRNQANGYHGSNNIHSNDTTWTLEKLNYFVYYKNAGYGRKYQVVYTCYKKCYDTLGNVITVGGEAIAQPVYFILKDPTNELTFTNGNMSNLWYTDVMTAVDEIWNTEHLCIETFTSDLIEILPVSKFKEGGNFWLIEYDEHEDRFNTKACGKFRSEWKEDTFFSSTNNGTGSDTVWVTEYDWNHFGDMIDYVGGHGIKYGWTNCELIPEMLTVINQNVRTEPVPYDVSLGTWDVLWGNGWETADWNGFMHTAWAGQSQMRFAEFMEICKNVQILLPAEWDSLSATFHPYAKGYGFIINGASIDPAMEGYNIDVTKPFEANYWDRVPDQWYATDSPETHTLVCTGFISSRGNHLNSTPTYKYSGYNTRIKEINVAAADSSMGSARYPFAHFLDDLLEVLLNADVSITTRSPQYDESHMLSDKWRRKCEELSVKFYDQHPGDISRGEIPDTDRYNFWASGEAYDNAWLWYTHTLTNSIGDNQLMPLRMEGSGNTARPIYPSFNDNNNGDYWPRLSKMYVPTLTYDNYTDVYFGTEAEGPCNEGQGSFIPNPGTLEIGDGVRWYQCSGFTMREDDIFVILREMSADSTNANTVADTWLSYPGPAGYFGNAGHLTLSSGLSLVVEEYANAPWALFVKGWTGATKLATINGNTYTVPAEGYLKNEMRNGNYFIYCHEPITIHNTEEVNNWLEGGKYGRYGGHYTLGAFTFHNNRNRNLDEMLFTIYQLHLNTLFTYNPALDRTQYKLEHGEYRGNEVTKVNCSYAIDI